MQIKTTSYYCTLIRMAKIKNGDNIKFWQECSPSLGEHCDTSVPWNTTQQLKGKDCWRVQKLEWMSKELCWMKRNLIPKDFTVHSIYTAVLKWQSFRNGNQISGCQGLRNKEIAKKEVGVAIKIPCDNGIVLDFDCGSGYTNLHIW